MWRWVSIVSLLSFAACARAHDPPAAEGESPNAGTGPTAGAGAAPPEPCTKEPPSGPRRLGLVREGPTTTERGVVWLAPAEGGLALERSGVATIQSRDEATRSYDIRTTGVTTQSPGWLKRAVTLGMAGDKKVTTPVNLRVRVSGTDGASSVLVEGASTASDMNAARQVLETLRQRMN